MILAAHQPDLFPYPGFWRKMAEADVFALLVDAQFQKHGYQRRVRMRERWAALPLAGRPALVPISSVLVAPDGAERLTRMIEGRYRGARFWRARGDLVLSWVDQSVSAHLWQFNLGLILKVRDYLEIPTPLTLSPAWRRPALGGLIDLCHEHQADEYLSGRGAEAYAEDPETRFAQADLKWRWLDWRSPTPDSILTVLFDEPDPKAVIWG